MDISLSKRKLATVDEEGICVIYDTERKEIINQVGTKIERNFEINIFYKNEPKMIAIFE